MSDESLSRVQRLRAALTTQHLPCDIWLIGCGGGVGGTWLDYGQLCVGGAAGKQLPLLPSARHLSIISHCCLPLYVMRAFGAVAAERSAYSTRQHFYAGGGASYWPRGERQ